MFQSAGTNQLKLRTNDREHFQETIRELTGVGRHCDGTRASFRIADDDKH